jgi:hypothetical protein
MAFGLNNCEKPTVGCWPRRRTAGARLAIVARRFRKDERGTAFLEFILIIYAFLFILMGVVQTGLMVSASFYTNYAAFMAMRTAAVQYEVMEDNFISQNDFETRCKYGALTALGPIERFWWQNELRIDKAQEILSRIRFVYEESSDRFDGRANQLKGRLEYDYRLIVPFVGRVIAGLTQSGVPAADRAGARSFAYDTTTAWNRYPTVKLRSNNDLNPDGSPPRFHQMVIQRRWKFPARTR